MKKIIIASFIVLFSVTVFADGISARSKEQLFNEIVELITSKGMNGGKNYKLSSKSNSKLTLELKVFNEASKPFGAEIPSSYTYYPLIFKQLQYVELEEDNIKMVTIGFTKNIKSKEIDSNGKRNKAKAVVSYDPLYPKPYLKVNFEKASDAAELVSLLEELIKLI